MNQNVQISSTISAELMREIERLAEKEQRTVSNMGAILLQQAVKERQRKRSKKSDE